MQMNYDRLHGRLLVSHYLVATLFPCTPAVRLDARLLLAALLLLALYLRCDAGEGEA
jgi:hypothetical protein